MKTCDDLLNIRRDVEVREHHALGSPVLPLEKITVARSSARPPGGAAPRADCACSSIHCGVSHASASATELLTDARRLHCVFKKESPAGDLQLWKAFNKCF
jgi:hypothetical protein